MPDLVTLEDDAKRGLARLDKSVRVRILKKLIQLQREGTPSRHLHAGLPYFVEEISGYRIAFKYAAGTKTVYFIGDHKEYEKWYRAYL